jgi:hypothetical protein
VSQTPFVETELLLAVLEDDEDKALTLLDGMTDNETMQLMITMDRLAHLIRYGVLRD